jgi:hypothetical protein
MLLCNVQLLGPKTEGELSLLRDSVDSSTPSVPCSKTAIPVKSSPRQWTRPPPGPSLQNMRSSMQPLGAIWRWRNRSSQELARGRSPSWSSRANQLQVTKVVPQQFVFYFEYFPSAKLVVSLNWNWISILLDVTVHVGVSYIILSVSLSYICVTSWFFFRCNV